MTIYQVKLKEKRDRENQLEFAEQTGIEKGIKKGFRKGIRKGILKGIEKGIEKGKNAMCNEIINRMKSKDIPIMILQRLPDYRFRKYVYSHKGIYTTPLTITHCTLLPRLKPLQNIRTVTERLSPCLLRIAPVCFLYAAS